MVPRQPSTGDVSLNEKIRMEELLVSTILYLTSHALSWKINTRGMFIRGFVIAAASALVSLLLLLAVMRAPVV